MTRFSYFRNQNCLQETSKITGITKQDQNVVLHLTSTPFYPGGGGQPCDVGCLCSDNGLDVTIKKISVSPENKTVEHIGILVKGNPQVGDEVLAKVDQETRHLHSRLHTAGHLIDAGMVILKPPFDYQPLKGYHYPDGPSVTYSGRFSGDKEALKVSIQEQCDRLVEQDLPVFIDFENNDPEDTTCKRNVRIADIISMPCGGTHVMSLKAIGKVIIRRIESKKDVIKVGYQVSLAS